ncbi:MAG: large conductance mechanosensitive channel protein MscL [Clostridia bacterium]
MGLIKEFKEFALKGNVMDMAVGVIIGGAFTSVVTGVVNNIFTPIVEMVTGKLTFDAWKAGIPGYGSALIGEIINFLIVALCLFLIIKAIKTAEEKATVLAAKALGKDEEEAPAPTTKVCPYCKSEIPIDAVKCAHCTSDVE